MTRLTLPWSGTEFWIPACWRTWRIDGVNFRRDEHGRILLETGPNAWSYVNLRLIDDDFVMPRNAA